MDQSYIAANIDATTILPGGALSDFAPCYEMRGMALDLEELRYVYFMAALYKAGGNRPLADIIDTDQNYISQIRHKHRKVGPDIAARIQQHFGFSSTGISDLAVRIALFIETLPEESQHEVIEFLRFKRVQNATEKTKAIADESDPLKALAFKAGDKPEEHGGGVEPSPEHPPKVIIKSHATKLERGRKRPKARRQKS